MLGLANNSIDLQDNAYVRIAAYLLDASYELKEEIKLRKCTTTDLETMMPKEVTVFYPNSMCFDKRPTLEGNWFDADFKNIFWTVEAC